VAPFWAVTTIVIRFVPVFRIMLPDATPEDTAVPLTEIEAAGSDLVAVKVISAVLWKTAAE
jgi:hypothetical protein